MIRLVTIFIAVLIYGGVASADYASGYAEPGYEEYPGYGEEPSMEAAQVPQSEATAQDGLLDDPNADRNFFSATALTAPKGSFSVNSTELFYWRAKYSVSDRFEIGVGILPIPDETVVGSVHFKYQMRSSGKVRTAITGMLMGNDFFPSQDSSDYNGKLTIGHFGGSVTLCVDWQCRSNATLSGGIAVGDDGGYEPETLFTFSGAGQLAVTRGFKLIGEYSVLSAEYESMYVVSGGVRMAARNYAVDLGITSVAFDYDDGDDGAILPYLSATYRWL